jgi:hypothetical protein
MDTTISQLELLRQLDARHDDLLEKLEQLEKRVAQVLEEWTGAVPSGGKDRPSSHPLDQISVCQKEDNIPSCEK